MTDEHIHTHTHGDNPVRYADPNDLPYNELQKESISLLSTIVRGVYGVGIDPDDHLNLTIVDFEAGSQITGRLLEDGDVHWQDGDFPTLIWGFSAIQHPHLEEGNGNELFHVAFQELIDRFASEDINLQQLVDLGRQLGMILGIVPNDADTREIGPHQHQH